MSPPIQTASYAPISFVFHNTADGSKPIVQTMAVRPEELTRSDASRLNVTQTLGGAWADNFGQGLPTIQIAGTTGWGQGAMPDGYQAFLALYKLIYVGWHQARAGLVKSNQDPNLVKLIFDDQLNGYTWVVAPTQFVLKRSKSRPLLSQYQINLTYVSADIASTMAVVKQMNADKQQAAIASLGATYTEFSAFVKSLNSSITAFFGPIQQGVNDLLSATSSLLGTTMLYIGTGMSVINTATGALINLTAGLSLAASNVFAAMSAVQAIPTMILAQITRVRSLLLNAFCVLKNNFQSVVNLPNYDSVYGASLCSSTNGGRPLSQYLTSNTMEAINPIVANRLSVTSGSMSAIQQLGGMDVVLAPMTLQQTGSLSLQAANGILVAH